MDYAKLDPEALAALVSSMTRTRTAHGVLMVLAVVLWFPLGVFLLRLLRSENIVRWHAIWQCIGLVLLVVGFGLGSWLSKKAGRSQEAHVLLGTVITIIFILMPVFGWLHHRQWAATKKKTYKRHIHVWGGRVLLLLAFINAITGLRLSKVQDSAYIAYGVVAGLFGLAYAGVWSMRTLQARQSVEETELENTLPEESK